MRLTKLQRALIRELEEEFTGDEWCEVNFHERRTVSSLVARGIVEMRGDYDEIRLVRPPSVDVDEALDAALQVLGQKFNWDFKAVLAYITPKFKQHMREVS